MKSRYIFAIGIAIMIVCGTFLTGCGDDKSIGNDNGASINVEADRDSDVDIKENGIQLKNYLELYTEGQNGYAKLYVDFDFKKLEEDCRMYLKESVDEYLLLYSGCETIDEYLKKILQDIDTYDIVTCSDSQNISNGDICEVSISIPKGLEKILTVEISGLNESYKITGLDEFVPVEPFKHVEFGFEELVSTGNQIGYKLRDTASAAVVLPDGTVTFLPVQCDVDTDNVYTLEDSVRIYLSEETLSKYKEKFEHDIFTEKETEIKLKDVMGYLPDGDDANEIFEVMDEVCLDNVLYCTKKIMDDCTETNTDVSVVGMMLYHDEEGKLEERDFKFYNQIVFICKVQNDIIPDGWYTYMAYNGPMYIDYQLDKGEIRYYKCVREIFGSHMYDDFRYYQNEHPRMVNGNYPASFELNGVTYPGHMDIEDVVKALEANVSTLKEYDHLIVSDSLKDYVEEY